MISTRSSPASSRFPALVGQGRRVRTILGGRAEYLDADAAATTRSLVIVNDKVQEFLASYGSVHRGSGAYSRASTEIFTAARTMLLEFVGADPQETALCIAQNTTAAINKLRRKLDLRTAAGDSVFLSEFEHSSNDLPWRAWQPVRIPTTADGMLDLDALDRQLAARPAAGRKLVAVTGASNLTGGLTPLADVARITHRHGGLLLVDAAQLAGHRAISMQGTGDGDHIDFLAFCGHKMYAPFGAGLLVGSRRLLTATGPDEPGGGTVDFVTTTEYDLSTDAFRRENSGTPNAVGVVAAAVAARVLKEAVGFEAIVRHEQELLSAARDRLSAIDGLRVLGEMDYLAARKCAILSFVLEGVDHALLAARLSHEFGIGVRHGHLCQFAYVARLLGLDACAVADVRSRVAMGDRAAMYGVVRASFGLSNRVDDVVRLGDALTEIRDTPERASLYERTAAGDWLPRERPANSAAAFFRL